MLSQRVAVRASGSLPWRATTGMKIVVVHADASAAIGIAHRKGLGKVRHIDTQALWVQEAMREMRICLKKAQGCNTPADLMTKALARETMDGLLRRMGLVRAEGRSSIALTLVKDEKGGCQEFRVEKEVDGIEDKKQEVHKELPGESFVKSFLRRVEGSGPYGKSCCSLGSCQPY